MEVFNPGTLKDRGIVKNATFRIKRIIDGLYNELLSPKEKEY